MDLIRVYMNCKSPLPQDSQFTIHVVLEKCVRIMYEYQNYFYNKIIPKKICGTSKPELHNPGGTIAEPMWNHPRTLQIILIGIGRDLHKTCTRLTQNPQNSCQNVHKILDSHKKEKIDHIGVLQTPIIN